MWSSKRHLYCKTVVVDGTGVVSFAEFGVASLAQLADRGTALGVDWDWRRRGLGGCLDGEELRV